MAKLFVFLGIFLLLNNFTFSQSLDEYLIAYYSFDDSTATDNSGNGYNGKLMNNPMPALGVSGTCFRFQGKDKFIEVSQSKSLIGDYIQLPRIPLENYSEFTMMCWVNKERFEYWGGTAYLFFGEVIDKWIGIYHAGKYPLPTTWVKFSTGSIDDTDEPYAFDYPSNFDNRWIHYALVYKSNYLYVYINGKLIGSKNQPYKNYNNNAGIATHWWYYDNQHRQTAGFTGRIDEVKIFSKALTDEEIKKEGCINNIELTAYNRKLVKMDFGEIGYSVVTSQYILLKNLTSNEIIINDSDILFSKNVSFSFPQTQFPIIIPGLSEKYVRICFQPLSLGLHSDTLLIYDKCKNHSILLTGWGIYNKFTADTKCNFGLYGETEEIIDKTKVVDENYDEMEGIYSFKLLSETNIPQNANYRIFNYLGQEVQSGVLISSGSQILLLKQYLGFELKLPESISSLYFVVIQFNGIQFTKKIITNF